MASEQGKCDDPLHIPLDFEQAVEGLLGVKPKKSREQQAEPDDSAEEKPEQQEG